MHLPLDSTADVVRAIAAAALLAGAARAGAAPAVAASPEQEIAWHASAPPAGDQPFDIVATDLDGDGDVDLAVTDSKDSTVSVYRGNGDGSFAPRSRFATGRFPRGLVVADFDRDGIADLAVAATQGGGVFVHFGRGGGAFSAASIAAAPSPPSPACPTRRPR